MGLLIEGKWHRHWYDTKASGGKFVRTDSTFRNWITPDGSAGPSGLGGFAADVDRYHLYVSLACPWAHRTLIFRALKGLKSAISVSVVAPYMGEHGWAFPSKASGSVSEGVSELEPSYMHQVYTRAQADFTGRVTVPVLWDKHQHTIVSNESSEIIRMLNSAFNAVGATSEDYYPKTLRKDIDAINQRVYHRLNNGVYKAGFATTQASYEEAVTQLFEELETLEKHLQSHHYLVGEQLTEADWRLFTTLVRFDAVYVGHFKCNLKRIMDMPALQAYMQRLYQVPGVAATVNMQHIKEHYYQSHPTINPTSIVPLGPQGLLM